jgi:hypothetical protein
MTYHIKIMGGYWRLLRRGAIIGTYGSRIEARIALHSEQLIRGER